MTAFTLDMPDVVALHPADDRPSPAVDPHELADRVLRRARHAPLAPALVTAGAVTYSYGWLRDTVRETAAVLRRRVPDGRAVAITGRDHPLLVVTVLAGWHARLPVRLVDDTAPATPGAAVVIRLCCHEETGVPVFELIDLPPVEGDPGQTGTDPRDDPMMAEVILPLTLGSSVRVTARCAS